MRHRYPDPSCACQPRREWFVDGAYRLEHSDGEVYESEPAYTWEQVCLELGWRLGERRRAAGVTQPALGARIGRTRRQVAQVEAGEFVTLQILMLHAAALGADYKALFEGLLAPRWEGIPGVAKAQKKRRRKEKTSV